MVLKQTTGPASLSMVLKQATAPCRCPWCWKTGERAPCFFAVHGSETGNGAVSVHGAENRQPGGSLSMVLKLDYVIEDFQMAKQSAWIHLLYGDFRALSVSGWINNCQTLQITIWLLSGWIWGSRNKNFCGGEALFLQYFTICVGEGDI